MLTTWGQVPAELNILALGIWNTEPLLRNGERKVSDEFSLRPTRDPSARRRKLTPDAKRPSSHPRLRRPKGALCFPPSSVCGAGSIVVGSSDASVRASAAHPPADRTTGGEHTEPLAQNRQCHEPSPAGRTVRTDLMRRRKPALQFCATTRATSVHAPRTYKGQMARRPQS